MFDSKRFDLRWACRFTTHFRYDKGLAKKIKETCLSELCPSVGMCSNKDAHILLHMRKDTVLSDSPYMGCVSLEAVNRGMFLFI